jgi:hypothetical protein
MIVVTWLITFFEHKLIVIDWPTLVIDSCVIKAFIDHTLTDIDWKVIVIRGS